MKFCIILISLAFSVYGHELINKYLIHGNKSIGVNSNGKEINGEYSYSKVNLNDDVYKVIYFKVARQNRSRIINDTNYNDVLWYKNNSLLNCSFDASGIANLRSVGDVFLEGVRRNDKSYLIFRPNAADGVGYNFERVDSLFFVNGNYYSQIKTSENNACVEMFYGNNGDYSNKYHLEFKGIKIGVDEYGGDYSKYFVGRYKRVKNDIETAIYGVVDVNGEKGDCELKFTDVGILSEIAIKFKPNANYFGIKKFYDKSFSYLEQGPNDDGVEKYGDCLDGVRCASLSRDAMSMRIWMVGINSDEIFYKSLKDRADSLSAYK